MITRERFLEAIKIVEKYKNQLQLQTQEVISETEKISPFSLITSDTLFYDIDGLSVRTLNVLHYVCKCKKVGDLAQKSISEIGRYRGVGARSLKEIYELCYYSGVKLKP